MTQPATKAEQLAQEYMPLLNDSSASMDELTLRRLIKTFQSEVADASWSERGVLFCLIGMAWFRLGSFEKAVEADKNAARYEPDEATHPNNMAAALLELGRVDEALVQLRAARSKGVVDRKTMLTVLGNEAEAHFRLGATAPARAALAEAVKLADPRDHIESFVLAMQAANIGCDDDAVEFFARHLALVQNTELGETPAAEFVRAAPDDLKARMREVASLSAAVQRVTARFDATEPAAEPRATVDLTRAQQEELSNLLENPPAPTDALRRLMHERHA